MDGGGGGGFRPEAERWLTISEKLLTARDFQGAKSFAIRARESDPRLLEFADQIIAVADTLLAGELRIINYSTGSNNHDYYAILQLPRLSQSMELVASQYRKLALLLNPTRNGLSFADHAFRLVSEAWLVFSDPNKKGMYDHELQLSQLGHLGSPHHQHHQQQFDQISFTQNDYHHYQQQNQHQQLPNLSLTESNRSTRMTHPEMPEPIRPIPQHKAAPDPSRTIFFGQPRVTESTPTSAQPRAAAPATESVRPVVQKSPKSTPPATTTASTAAAATPTTPTTLTHTNNNNNSNNNNNNNSNTDSSSTRVARSSSSTAVTESELPGFWTACPYCFILYEYPKGYEDCAIRCQKCKRAFQALVIPSPSITGKDTYFCCWSCFPLGFSGDWNGGGGTYGGFGWSPVSAMFAVPLPGAGKSKQGASGCQVRSGLKEAYTDGAYIDLSEPSDSDDNDDYDDDDDDWDNSNNNGRKKVKSGKGKSRAQTERSKKVIVQNGDDRTGVGVGGRGNVQGEAVRKGEGSSGRKRGAKDLGKLDLNVMFSNEVEEAAPGVRVRNGAGNREEDNIEGNGFFEGLDEFLSSLPILSVVGDDKVKAS